MNLVNWYLFQIRLEAVHSSKIGFGHDPLGPEIPDVRRSKSQTRLPVIFPYFIFISSYCRSLWGIWSFVRQFPDLSPASPDTTDQNQDTSSWWILILRLAHLIRPISHRLAISLQLSKNPLAPRLTASLHTSLSWRNVD